MKFVVVTWMALTSYAAFGQGTAADYQRMQSVRQKFPALATDVPGAVTWIDAKSFWYRKTVNGGNEFVLVDAGAEPPSKKPAFDHERLAAALSSQSGQKYTAVTLPFTEISFVDNGKALDFAAAGSQWNCSLADYICRKTGAARTGGRGGRGGRGPSAEDDPPAEFDNDVVDGIVVDQPAYALPQQGQGGRGGRGQTQTTQANQALPAFSPFGAPPEPDLRPSPDGKSEAFIRNYNVFVRAKGAAQATALSFDGSEGNYYTTQSISWSPDSKRLVAYRTVPGYKREVHYVQSSPVDQLQPKHSAREYAKPGDTVDIAHPVLFHVETKNAIAIDDKLFPNPYSLSRAVWWKDGRGFTFEYNQRGHQAYRVIEVNLEGEARTLIDETSKTFIDYRPLVANRTDTGKKVRHDLNDGKEIIWGSERDGWEHLYLFDGVTGKLKNQITKGPWVVRGVDKVDEAKRQIWFEAGGMEPGKDPYFLHAYRINFDGTGLTPLTVADGNHSVKFSSDMKYYVDTWSRVEMAPVSELRRAEDASLVMSLEKGDTSALLAAGWKAPESFVAKGRDGATDIWGVIYRPTNFDPAKKYPVVESIYAGPQGSFVQKDFSAAPPAALLSELGFIVVQIDGMGTNNRSRAFHDVAFHNLKDAGFEDRILWHKAVAAKYPWYDISRVGIYGTSAGGQNSMGAMLFHPEFYKAAVSNSGCHDNRMDKMWWNEQWMGWPLGPQYAESSNMENASKLQGKLLLVMGELDTNVDPSSTLQVVNALIKANKKFDFLYVPGAGHGTPGPYAQRVLQDFFVHNLLGVEPPEWSREEVAAAATPAGN